MYKTARDVLQAHWDGKLPVNPVEIARRMGVMVEGDPFMVGSGYYRANHQGRPHISYNSLEPAVRQRFTVAHEIGHFVHGDEDAPRDTLESFNAKSREPREIAANKFAAALLMPAEMVKFLVREQRMTDLSSLAKKFGVSTAAMKFRLTNLGLI
jgi:Zn-dependent peptidase ImmA (M78 family)